MCLCIVIVHCFGMHLLTVVYGNLRFINFLGLDCDELEYKTCVIECCRVHCFRVLLLTIVYGRFRLSTCLFYARLGHSFHLPLQV